MRRPLFGHGLGTSREANANFGGNDQPSHNLYTEVAQEIGFLGLILFVAILYTVATNLYTTLAIVRSRPQAEDYLKRLTDALQVWLALNLVFSLASYGLTSYEWYSMAGLSEVVRKLASKNNQQIASRSSRRPHGIRCWRVSAASASPKAVSIRVADPHHSPPVHRLLAVVRHPVGGSGPICATSTAGCPPLSRSRCRGARRGAVRPRLGTAASSGPGEHSVGPSASALVADAVARELASGHHDVMHSHGFTAGAVASLANLVFRRPHVLTSHDVFLPEHFNGRRAG